jgi:hypothetical protein
VGKRGDLEEIGSGLEGNVGIFDGKREEIIGLRCELLRNRRK